MALHAELGSGRWRQMTLAQQLANVGSEVDRAIRAWEGGQSGRFEGALDRALELFDLTAADDRWRGPRRREILRARRERPRTFVHHVQQALKMILADRPAQAGSAVI